MVDVSRAHKILLTVVLFLLLSLSSLHVHGYSLSMWHRYIDGSSMTEILRGEPRSIRSDDWLVDIPFVLAQARHSPPFPVVNTNIGVGQNMMAPSRAPTRNFLLLFRPGLWGFLVGVDFGISWMWLTLVLGLFYAWFLVFLVVSRNDFTLSLFAGLTLVFSPFFQFWSFYKAEIPIHTAASFVSLLLVLFSSDRRIILLNGLLLGWSLGCLTLNYIYPPLQIAHGYLLAFLVIGYIAQHGVRSRFKEKISIRLIALSVAVGIVLSAGLSFYLQAGDAIRLIAQTVYPGQRFEPGGGFPIWRYFTDHFLVHGFISDWAPMENESEGSTFFLWFPFVLMIFLYGMWSRGVRPATVDRLAVSLFLYIGLLLGYALWGLPEVVATYTQLGRLTPNRTVMAIGIADLILLVWLLSRPDAIDLGSRGRHGLVVLCWLALLAVVGGLMGDEVQELTVGRRLMGLTAVGALSLMMYARARRWQRLFMPALAVGSLAYTYWFNPVVVGGSDYLVNNPLVRAISRIHAQSGGKNQLVVMSSSYEDVASTWVLNNLPRMLGVQSLGGHHNYPQAELYEPFDPEKQWVHAYNRSGSLTFHATAASTPSFLNPAPGSIALLINPNHRAFDTLGVRYFLVIGNRLGMFTGNSRFRPVFSYHGKHIFERVGAGPMQERTRSGPAVGEDVRPRG